MTWKNIWVVECILLSFTPLIVSDKYIKKKKKTFSPIAVNLKPFKSTIEWVESKEYLYCDCTSTVKLSY